MPGAYRSLLDRGWGAVLLLFLAAGALLAPHLRKIDVDAGTNVLLNEDDPDLAYYNSTRGDWGYDEYAIFCVTHDDWFTTDGVGRLTRIVAGLEKLPHVRSVTSLLSIPLLRQKPGTAPKFPPETSSLDHPGCNLDRAREELLDHELAVGNLVSKDGRNLSLLVHLDVPPETRELDPVWSRLQGEALSDPSARGRLRELQPRMDAANAELRRRRTAMIEGIRRVAAEWTPQLAEPVRLSGVPVININLVEHIAYDLRVFGVAAFAFFTLAFLAVYRRLRWTALPILTCLLPVVLILGAVGLGGMKLTVITSNMPVLLFVLMLPYTVYLIERYRECRSLDPARAPAECTLESARFNWTPCLYSCTTTMAGFASLLTSGINPVRSFGLMMTIGMGIGLACVFLFLPSAMRPLRDSVVPNAGAAAGTRGIVRFFERITLGAPGAVLVVSLLLLVASIWGITRLRVETKFVDYFWPSSEVYRGLEFIDQRVGGTTSLEILLRSPEKGFFRKTEGLNALRAAAAYFDGVPETGNVSSLARLVDEGRKRFPKAKDSQLVAMLTVSAKEIVREAVDPEYRTSRIFIRMRETAPTLHRNRILAGLRKHLKECPELTGLEVRETGVFLLYANMLNSLIQSQKDTFLMVVAAIYLMILIPFRSPILALLVLVPQVLPAVACLGVMGWTGVPLDLVTVMIASIAMGVGIDAAIQYALRYRQELAVDGDRRAAVSRSHATIGRSIWIATSVTMAGFLVLVLSKFVPSVYFGIFTAVAMLMGQLAALTTLPSLLLLTGYPKMPRTRPT